MSPAAQPQLLLHPFGVFLWSRHVAFFNDILKLFAVGVSNNDK
jgi:hypothetical protein